MQFIEVDIKLKKTVPYNEILIALLNDIKLGIEKVKKSDT